MRFTKPVLLLLLLTLGIDSSMASDQFWKRIFKPKAAKNSELVQSAIQVADSTTLQDVEPIEPSAEGLVSPVSEEQPLEDEVVDYSLTTDYSMPQIDSLLSVWRTRQANDHFEQFRQEYILLDTAEYQSTLPDSIYIKRLKNLASPVSLPFNDVTKSYIARYTNTRYGTINRIMSLSQYYFPAIEEELIKNDIPIEFRAMPIIESALSSTAKSRAGAAGLWQFMPATAKAYGLEVNSLVDERFSPELSTKAACRYLTDMYRIYGNWTLVIASYNCGPGNVNKALARSGVDAKSGDFWDIYYYLPRETRGYVPAFIGASYAYAYHQQHNIEFEDSPLPLATDTIHINRIMHLGQVSEVLEIPMESLRALNPQYVKDIIPATTKEYSLRLPQQFITEYIRQEEAINALDEKYLKQYISPAAIEKAKSTPSYTVHRVKSGETLSSIAQKYRVSQSAIIGWNNLRNPNKLSVGQSLKIGGK